MKTYEALITHLKALGKDEAKRQLETDNRELKTFAKFLEQVAEDTNEPETYRELLALLTAYCVYGLEAVADRIGVELEVISTEDYKDALAMLKLEEEGKQPS